MVNKKSYYFKRLQIAKLVGVTKNSVTSIRNKVIGIIRLNAKDPVQWDYFQKDLLSAIEKAERRINKERKTKKN